MLPRAVLLIRLDQPHPAKQEAICLEHADRLNFQVVALCYHAPGCVAFVQAGGAEVVVVAIDEDLDDLHDEVSKVGGYVTVARETRSRIRREIGDLVQRMLKKDMSFKDIGEVLGMSTCEIKRTVSRLTSFRPRPGRRHDRDGG